MADESRLLETLAAFARTLTGRYGVSDVLHDLVEGVTAVLGLCGAGVCLLQAGQIRFLTAQSEAVAELERLQDLRQAGPCVDATCTGRLVTVADLAEPSAARRWPDYCAQAERAGIRAVAGIPMVAEQRVLGAMNLYDSQPRDWTEADLRIAGILADLATGYVVHSSELEQQRKLAVQLQQALDSRIIIEQAKGILAQAKGISVDLAYQQLRRHARNHNVSIAEVASAVVNVGLRP